MQWNTSLCVPVSAFGVQFEYQVMDAQTPFMFKGGEGVNAGQGEVEWVVAKERFGRV